MNLPMDVINLILVIGIILTLLAYLREYSLRQRLQKDGDRFLEDIKEKGWETLHSSIKKSQAIIGSAELEGIKIDATYQKKLSEIINATETSIKDSQAQLFQFMDNLQREAREAQEKSEKITETRVNQLFDNLETRLSNFLVETSQKTSSSIELELKSTRALIETYKQEQLKLIDENVLAMMEQTLGLVLNKKLSLEDHLDLVYESLEKAKVEKFIA